MDGTGLFTLEVLGVQSIFLDVDGIGLGDGAGSET